MRRRLTSTATGPAICGLFCMLLAACASTRAHPPKPVPLVDRTAETDFNLSEVAHRLEQAMAWAGKGNRALASTILDAAWEAMPAERVRDRSFVRVLQAATLGRIGEGRDETAAREVLAKVQFEDAPREQAEVAFALAQIEVGAGRFKAADDRAGEALHWFEKAGAFARCVDVTVAMAEDYARASQSAHARAMAVQGLSWARRIDDDLLLCDTVIELARYLPRDEYESTLEQGYEAAFRANDLWACNAVCAEALRLWYEAGDRKAAIKWGDRARDRAVGGLPTPESLGMPAGECFLFYARYALARLALGLKDERTGNALETALDAADAAIQQKYPEWVEKLRGGLLQVRKD